MAVNNLREQLESAIEELGFNIWSPINEREVEIMADHIEKNYSLQNLNQEELDGFIDSDALLDVYNQIIS